MKNNKSINTRNITILGMLIGLSYIGSLLKIQGTIAFDSLPGYFAALFLGPVYGFIVAGLGHLLTAITSGFPMTLPMHLIVALEMAFIAYLFGVIYKKTNGIVASIIAIILNGPILALLAVPVSIALKLPFNGWALFSFIITSLTIASALNVIIAYILFKGIKNKIK